MTITITREHAAYEYYRDGTTHATPTDDRESAILLAKHGRAHLADPGKHRVVRVEAVARTVNGDGTVGAWLPIENEGDPR